MGSADSFVPSKFLCGENTLSKSTLWPQLDVANTVVVCCCLWDRLLPPDQKGVKKGSVVKSVKGKQVCVLWQR